MGPLKNHTHTHIFRPQFVSLQAHRRKRETGSPLFAAAFQRHHAVDLLQDLGEVRLVPQKISTADWADGRDVSGLERTPKLGLSLNIFGILGEFFWGLGFGMPMNRARNSVIFGELAKGDAGNPVVLTLR